MQLICNMQLICMQVMLTYTYDIYICAYSRPTVCMLHIPRGKGLCCVDYILGSTTLATHSLHIRKSINSSL